MGGRCVCSFVILILTFLYSTISSPFVSLLSCYVSFFFFLFVLHILCLFEFVIFFFFFRQKPAYEFSACLVGSEMGIRNRSICAATSTPLPAPWRALNRAPISYHLQCRSVLAERNPPSRDQLNRLAHRLCAAKREFFQMRLCCQLP